MEEGKKFSLVKPTLETPFQIDFDWWKQHDNNWRIFLYSYLCHDHQAAFSDTGQEVPGWLGLVDRAILERLDHGLDGGDRSA